MKSKIIILVLVILSMMVGCKDKVKNKPVEPEQFKADKTVEVYSSILYHGWGTINDILSFAGIKDAAEFNEKYSFNIRFMNEIEEKQVAVMNLTCTNFNTEYNKCIGGAERIQINGSTIPIYIGEYYMDDIYTQRFTSHVRIFEENKLFVFITSMGFYDPGNIGVYDLDGNKIYGDTNVIEKYFTKDIELIDTLPVIENNILKYYQCDIENEKVMRFEYNLSTHRGSVKETIDAYCNTRQSFFRSNGPVFEKEIPNE